MEQRQNDKDVRLDRATVGFGLVCMSIVSGSAGAVGLALLPVAPLPALVAFAATAVSLLNGERMHRFRRQPDPSLLYPSGTSVPARLYSPLEGTPMLDPQTTLEDYVENAQMNVFVKRRMMLALEDSPTSPLVPEIHAASVHQIDPNIHADLKILIDARYNN